MSIFFCHLDHTWNSYWASGCGGITSVVASPLCPLADLGMAGYPAKGFVASPVCPLADLGEAGCRKALSVGQESLLAEQTAPGHCCSLLTNTDLKNLVNVRYLGSSGARGRVQGCASPRCWTVTPHCWCESEPPSLLQPCTCKIHDLPYLANPFKYLPGYRTLY